MTGLSPCGEIVRKGDPVRFRTALFAPPDKREGLFALYAFNLEIAKIAPMVSEPMIGEIRLQWWRDTLDMIGEGRVRSHEVVQPLAAIMNAVNLPRAPFDALIDARALDLDPAFPAEGADLITYLRDTAGSLTLLATRALGGEADEVARDAGLTIGMARYLAAVPVLAAQGAKPLPGPIDWRALRNGDKDEELYRCDVIDAGFQAAHNAYAERRKVPRSAAAALLEFGQARSALNDMAGHARFDDLVIAGPSPFRANLSNLWRGVTGRWW